MNRKVNTSKYFAIKPDVQKISILILLIFSVVMLYLFIKQTKDIDLLESNSFEQNSVVHNLKNQVSDLEDDKSNLEDQLNDLEGRIDDLENRKIVITYH